MLLAGLVLGFGKARSFFSKAVGEGGCDPEGIREMNLTSNSAEVVFQTGKACMAQINYGISQDGMLLQVPEAMASLNHRIRLAPLLPSTTYYYQIKIDGKPVDTIRSFMTQAVAQPTTPPAESTTVPTKAPTSGTYTLDDFIAVYGTNNSTFDVDKNGIVNSADWIKYSASH